MSECIISYEVYQGEDRDNLPFFVRDSLLGVYLDLTTATEITINVKHKTTGLVSMTLTGGEIAVVPATTGKLLLSIPDAKSNDMRLGEQDVEIVVDFGTTRRIAILEKGLTVLKRLS